MASVKIKTSQSKKKINKKDELKNINSDIAIRTSLIVGFPNESDRDFRELYDFIDEVKFDRVGVFTYSEEEGTYGQKEYKDNISTKIKKERLDELMKLQMDINLNKNKDLINTSQRVIIDTHTQEGFSIGRTFRDSPEIDNSVTFKAKLSIGEFYDAKIIDASHYNLTGEI